MTDATNPEQMSPIEIAAFAYIKGVYANPSRVFAIPPHLLVKYTQDLDPNGYLLSTIFEAGAAWQREQKDG